MLKGVQFLHIMMMFVLMKLVVVGKIINCTSYIRIEGGNDCIGATNITVGDLLNMIITTIEIMVGLRKVDSEEYLEERTVSENMKSLHLVRQVVHEYLWWVMYH